MARVFIDGFEHGSYTLWETTSGSVGSITCPTPPSGMIGSYCCFIAGNYFLRKTLAAASDRYISWKYKYADGNSVAIMTLYSGPTVMCYLKRDAATGYLKAYTGSGTLIATGTTVIDTNTVYRMELYYYIHDTAGRFWLKLNDATEIDFTGDTKPGSETTFNFLNFGYGGPGDNGSCYIDDVIIDDAAFPGATFIQRIGPASAGNSSQWTPSTGDNYACVDETPPSDTDYVYTDTVNHVDTYVPNDLSLTVSNIRCVQVQCRIRRSNMATPVNARPVIRSGGTDYTVADKPIPYRVGYIDQIWALDPADSQPWTAAKVNAIEIGIKAVT